ncbi:MAG TPA: VOC family protein [Candidatus Bathyarchaeia archaeon]|nr:VOC family protein [Candidatus Bathyarchaeia archaeon]
MIEGIDVVFVHVKDPEKTAKWYSDVLGLKISFQTQNNDWQEFSFENTQTTTRFALDYGGNDLSEVEQQPIIISFKVSNIHEAVEKLERKKVQFFGKEKIFDVGPTLIATFKDPEGNWIQLSQRK